MYQGGMVAKQEADKRADAQLLGEKDVELPEVEEASKVLSFPYPIFWHQNSVSFLSTFHGCLSGDR
jgi:hypothetical protein